MRLCLSFFLFLFLNCQSQIVSRNVMHEEKEIQFEDKIHYLFSLASKDFLIINSQQKMDEVFKLIHQKNIGNRFSPIPAIVENETYLIIKPCLKNSNDVSIDKIVLNPLCILNNTFASIIDTSIYFLHKCIGYVAKKMIFTINPHKLSG